MRTDLAIRRELGRLRRARDQSRDILEDSELTGAILGLLWALGLEPVSPTRLTTMRREEASDG